MHNNSDSPKREMPGLLIRIPVYVAVIVSVTFLLYLFWLNPTARMQRTISKLKSDDPAVRLEGVKTASSIPVSGDEAEPLARALRELLEKEEITEIRIAALRSMFKLLSDKNADTLVENMISENQEERNAAILPAMRHAAILPNIAWKVIAVMAHITRQQPAETGNLAFTESKDSLSRLLGENFNISELTVVNLALNLKSNEEYFTSEPDVHPPRYLLSDYPCDVETGKKLDANTITMRTIEARDFAKRFGLPE